MAEGQTAQACLTLTNLDSLSGAANITLNTHDSDPSTATGMRCEHMASAGTIYYFECNHDNGCGYVPSSTVGSDYLTASQEFTFDSAMPDTQVCMPILTLEDDLVEQTESVLVVATSISGVVVSGSPMSLEIHSKECEFLCYETCTKY